MTRSRTSWAWLAALLAINVACDGGDEALQHDAAAPQADGGSTQLPDAVASDAGVSEVSDGPRAPQLIPLIAWVDDLVDHRTNESSPPDTVDDKPVMGSEDAMLFDKYFE